MISKFAPIVFVGLCLSIAAECICLAEPEASQRFGGLDFSADTVLQVYITHDSKGLAMPLIEFSCIEEDGRRWLVGTILDRGGDKEGNGWSQGLRAIVPLSEVEKVFVFPSVDDYRRRMNE